MLDGFFLSDASPAQLLEGHSDAGLVVLSVLIAIVSAAVCLRLASVAQATTGPTQQAALLAGSLVLGSGIWAMHFVGMLAFDLCLTVNYDLNLTLISMVPSLLASWIALRILSKPRITRLSLLVGGVCVGVGIGAMHYSGMASMQMAPMLRYDPFWFAASLVVAVVLSTLALWIRFALRERLRAALKWSPETIKTVSALVMGGAISGMHYTAMAAARFVGTPGMLEGPSTGGARTLGMTVAFAALAVIGLIGLLMGLLRYRALWRRVESNEQRLQALLIERRKIESRLRVAASVFEHGYEGFMVLDARFRVTDINHAYQRMSGFSKSHCVGRTLEDLYGPLVLGQTFESVQEIVANTKHWQGEIEALDAGGVSAVHRISISAVLDDFKRIQHFIVVISDVTQEKSHERELEQIALYDSLTGLPNRRLLNDRLAQGIHAANRQKTLLAVLYLDLDGFKQVND
ncbi:MAG: MHYT domain-containing protein, partial [Comamonas sp.]